MRPCSSFLRLAAASVLLAGCGYESAGTWDDDPGNWERAFHSGRPPDVVVVHSKYWRSAHWTLEFQYFFHLGKNDALRKQLFAENKLARMEGEAAARASSDFFGDKPAWFLPGRVSDYEVWAIAAETGRHFRVFIDRRTGELFVADWTV